MHFLLLSIKQFGKYLSDTKKKEKIQWKPNEVQIEKTDRTLQINVKHKNSGIGRS